eukprot:248885-Pyramimonas_sp.AAC.1
MSYRALRHSNRKPMIRRASLKNLDARTRHAISTGAEKLLVLSNFFGDGDGLLDLTRAADELQSCSAQQSEGNPQAQ